MTRIVMILLKASCSSWTTRTVLDHEHSGASDSPIVCARDLCHVAPVNLSTATQRTAQTCTL